MNLYAEMSIYRRLLGSLPPVLVGTVLLLISPLYSNADWHLSTVHGALLVVTAVVALPAAVVCVYVRTRLVWATAVAMLSVLSGMAVVAMERSDASTNALTLLWVPFLGVPMALLAVAADRVLFRRGRPHPRRP